ncbi:MAG: DUF2922 domain-containing protein [Syntrophomonadaceae bacterium]|nr:DUF2922 domain-containing protein [Syntrophomonadaceae bacterium]MDD3022444.1 DUF2922 domain-containing protein [Syntrophomonadaceae bacterium]
MAIQRTLEMDFATALNKTQRMRVYDAREDVTAIEINTAMNDIIAKNIFSDTGGELTGIIGAQLVSKETTKFNL